MAAGGRSFQLALGSTHDAFDQRFGPHHFEDVADVWQQDGEVHEGEHLGHAHAPHRHVAGLDLGADEERVEDRGERKAQHQGIERVAGEYADDAG